LNFENSDFDIVSDFDIRISYLIRRLCEKKNEGAGGRA